MVVTRRKWDSDDLRDLVVGEDLWAERPFNKPLVIPGIVGGHQCGPDEWFRNGQPWPYLGPRVAYDADWIPACCDRAFPWGPVVAAQPDVLFPGDLVGPTAGASPGGEVSLNPTGDSAPVAGASPGGEVSLNPTGDSAPVGGAMPSGIDKLYCATYGVTVAEGVGNFTIPSAPFADLRWSASIPPPPSGSRAWDLRSPHHVDINNPGEWLLRKIASPNSRIYRTDGWSGRGSAVFANLANPLDTVTVSCTD